MKRICIAGLLLLLNFTTAHAYDEPYVNLGFTSFFDGGPPAGPGVYFQDYFQYFTTDQLKDKNGDRLPLPKTDVDVTVNITQLIYLSKIRVLGASLGMSALLPWVVNTSVDDGLSNTALYGQVGQGDLFIGPALQFDPVMRKDGQGPLWVHRLDLDIVVPTGEYNRNYAINPGSNFWSINPYWAGTFWFTPKIAASFRLHYLWNAKNHDPNVAFGPYARTTQAGQAVYANFAGSYQFTDKFFAGINGYWFNQFTDTKVNGADIQGRREKLWSIGPGLLYNITKNHFLFLNYYAEQDARNRAQAKVGVVRFVIHF
ncbi:transporter [Legionella sp. 16cNR16C]|uniref:SphA family protein n=1 Tax=Legionella sp. 16cNR16C TaxID=2905656 RepID=UPI001E62B86E|nr:transporter [Legionella sp. 16cNR16C]MCE3046154.1 transporter [Legionella sp. 16cNR16C]